ncbi:MAG: hypothetical protein Q4D62_11715 [Planctomycetia bacterium]|nr:hypothetical protein [Planctomycetia bacterium]
MNRWLGYLAGWLICGFSWVAAEMPAKRWIELGWDIPSTQFIRENWKTMEETTCFDGIIYKLQPDVKKQGGSSEGIFNPEHPWKREDFQGCIDDLKSCDFQKFHHNFIRVNFSPANVKWDDDAGWKVILEKVALCAWVAKTSGSKGLAPDFESYGADLFRYDSQSGKTFAETKALAKRRGAEFLQAVASEFPDATLLCLWLNSINTQAASVSNPDNLLATAGYGLLPAFINGMLSVLPPEMVLVDGCENGYYFNEPESFYQAALDMVLWTGRFVQLIEPEYRQTWRNQGQCGFGIYLDMYTNPEGNRYYRAGKEGETRFDRLCANLADALRCSDQYVWVYGEKNRWWNVPGGDSEIRHWNTALPGLVERMEQIRNPEMFAKKQVTLYLADPQKQNLLKNADFSQKRPEGNLPAEWGFWQHEKTSFGKAQWDGSVGEGSASFEKVMDGCYIQSLPVQPGERYLLHARVKTTGSATAKVAASWQTAEGQWTRWDATQTFVPADSSQEWSDIYGLITVPESAAKMVILPSVSQQYSEKDGCWYDSIGIFTAGE